MKRAEIYNGLFSLVLPDHVADWDVLSYWERPRFHSIGQHLTHEDLLFVVGAEHGFVAATYAKLTRSIVLFEPTPSFWPNIRLTWEANGLEPPYATVAAFVGDEPRGSAIITPRHHWPAWAEGPEGGKGSYCHMRFSHSDHIPVILLDDFVARAGLVPPRGISIDVEGAEMHVLRGAVMTLAAHRPHVWCSLHPDLMARDYQTTPNELRAFMRGLEYDAHLIAVDHEEHWLFVPVGIPH